MTRRRKVLYFIGLLFLICAVWVTVTIISTNIARANLFSEMDCALPCWYQIRPGQSTEEEFLAIAKEHPRNFVGLSRHEGSEIITYHWADRDLRLNLTAFIQHNHVQLVRIIGRGALNLGDLTSSVTAQPDLYEAYALGDGGGENLYSLSATFMYEELGITYQRYTYPDGKTELRGEEDCSITIEKDFPIDRVYIVDNIHTTEFLEAIAYKEDMVEEWKAFGEVKLSECPLSPNRTVE